MDTASLTLRLGGHQGNTVQKWDVTPGEIAVLRLIHGDESVSDVKFMATVNRSHRAELERLHQTYGRRGNDGRTLSPAVAQLFPGAAARVYETLDELDLDPSYVTDLGPSGTKAPEPKAAASADPEDVSLDKLTKTQLLQIASERGVEVSADDKKADIVKAIEKAPAEAVETDADEDMPDEAMFN